MGKCVELEEHALETSLFGEVMKLGELQGIISGGNRCSLFVSTQDFESDFNIGCLCYYDHFRGRPDVRFWH